MKGGERLLKKRKLSSEPTAIPSLPYDLLVSCLARVSRLHYPFLSLVLKSFRSILASPELYQTRKLLSCTKSCLYVCLQFPSEPNPRWFTLSQRPDQTLTNHTKKKSSGNVLAPIRVLNSPTAEWSNLVAVGPYLYAISGDSTSCSSVSFLDCRTHTWLEAPRMRLSHSRIKLDEMMYLPGSGENLESWNFIEVFNSNTKTWNRRPPGERIFNRENMGGKIYDQSYGQKGLAFNLKEKTWEMVGYDLDEDFQWVSVCRIANITYSFKFSGEFVWIDDVSNVWRKLKGLEGLPKFARYCNVKLADYGGKLVVLWDRYVRARGGYKEKMMCGD